MKHFIFLLWWALMLTVPLINTPLPAEAYWPPLTTVLADIQGGNTVRCRVFDPQLNQDVDGYQTVNNPRNLQVQDGIVTWVSDLDVSRCFFWFSVYDPGRKAWITSSFNWIWTVDQVTVSDGVVMATGKYNEFTPSRWYVFMATYDPAIGAWRSRYDYYDGPGPAKLQSKCGIVAYAVERPSDMQVIFTTYDPQIQEWVLSGEIVHNGTLSDLLDLVVQDATVSITLTGGNLSYRYHWQYNGWEKNPAAEYPLAYFVAQRRGLWLWLTDMSLGAQSWLWGIQTSSIIYYSMARSLYRKCAGGELLTVN
jgi:hypothetical protein